MKTKNLFAVTALLAVGIAIAAAQQNEPPAAAEPAAETATNAPSADEKTAEAVAPAPQKADVAAPENSAAQTPEPAPTVSAPLKNGEGLRLNFRNVPLELVLNYLSDAAGFIILLDPAVRDVKGKVDVWSNQPLSKDEAVDLLNTVLSKNGYTAIRNGRTLNIVNRDDAKTRDIPVKSGNDPAKIPRSDEVVTQIIPIRYVNATQLLKDLQPLVSLQTSLTANEAGNAVVITDTQANIKRVAEIIAAIDGGAEDVTEVRVFHLSYADPVEMAELLTGLFPDDSKTDDTRSQVSFRDTIRDSFFGGRGGGDRGGGGGGGNNQGGSSTQQRAKKKSRIIALADQRTASVVVSAASDLMEQISRMVVQLDSNPSRKQKVFVYSLENADSQQVEQILKDMFQKSTTQNSRNTANQNSALTTRSSQNATTSGTGTGTGNSSLGNTRGTTGGGTFP